MKIQACILLFLLCISYINAEPLITISQGTLNGTIKTARYGRSFSAFLGIPFAQPPIENRRFRNPLRAGRWVGIRSADAFGNICPQRISGLISGKEDCLFLNVYTPYLNFQTHVPRKKLLPVMVWIHGGSLLTGSSSMYGAGYLMQKDIILVTINYRLGILGFLSTGDSIAPGNFGLKDQVEALKWVQRNIRSFGGNPKKVTLFGESSGGVSVNLHSISKASCGLFQKYIIQSGTALGPSAYQEKKEFEAQVQDLAKLFNCPINSTRNMINCLRKVNADDLIKTSSEVETVLKNGNFMWSLAIEANRKGAFLTELPLQSINNNQMKDLPFMSGTVTDEGLALTGPLYSNDFLYLLFRTKFKTLFSYLAQYYHQDSRKFLTAVDEFYFNKTLNFTSKDVFLNTVTKFLSDAVFFYPEIRLLEKVTPKMKNFNYLYSFGYRGAISLSALSGDTRNHGVSHGDDVLYLFPLTYGTLVTTNANFTRTDESISKIMVDFWTTFATNGKPTTSELINPNLWQPYSPRPSAYIQIGNIRNNKDPTVSVSNDYFSQRINFWRKNAPI